MMRLHAPAAWLLTTLATLACAADLERLPFNHPGLTVDLAVGLWAWPLPMDADGDGDLDLVVSCPDKPYNGLYVFANATGDTAKNPLPVFKAARRIGEGRSNVVASRIGATVHVLRPGLTYPDLLTTGLAQGVRIPDAPKITVKKPRGEMWRHVDHDGDGVPDLLIGTDDWSDYGWDNGFDATGHWTRGPLHGHVWWARNAGTADAPRYEAPVQLVTTDGRPIEVFGWPSPDCADLDGDGDLDLVCGEFLDGFTYFANVGTRTAPRFAPGRRLKTADGSPLAMHLQMITPSLIDWNKDGHPDLICGDEDGRVAYIEHAGRFDADRTPLFLPPRYFRQEADILKYGALATPVGCDWDGDGDTDLICGCSAGTIAFIKNLSGPGVARPRWAEPEPLAADGVPIRIMAGPNGSIQGPAEAKWGYTTQTVADWDGDGLPDLLANSIWGKVVWYRNLGPRYAPRLAAAQPITVAWDSPQPSLAWGWLRPDGDALFTQWRTTPVAVDWNRDGLMDLVMLDQEGCLAYFERVRRDGTLILLPPRRCLHDAQGTLRLNAKAAGHSGRRKLCIVDWDGDGKLDILLNSTNARFLRQTGVRDGIWTFQDMGPLSAQSIEGHDVSPTVVDFDGDRIPDYLGGAEDGHFYFMRNPRSGGK